MTTDNMPAVTQRIRQIVDNNYRGSVRAFCRALGLSDSQKVNRLFNPDTRSGKYPTPSIDIVTLISNKLDISLLWLQSGQGQIFVDSNDNSSQSESVGFGDLLLVVQQHGRELMQHGEELRKQGERLDRMIDMIEQHQKGAFSPASQVGLQKSPPHTIQLKNRDL